MVLRRSLLAVLVLVAASGVPGLQTGAPAAAGSIAFGQPFRLNNPSNPFVFGVQDVEPSVRVDTMGNLFPGAIRWVPAGVDLWRVFPPYDSAHFEYLGSPMASRRSKAPDPVRTWTPASAPVAGTSIWPAAARPTC